MKKGFIGFLLMAFCMPFLVQAQFKAPLAVVYDTIDTCNSYTWIDGYTYTTNSTGYQIIKSTLTGDDSVLMVATFIIRQSSTANVYDTSCGNYVWALNGNIYAAPGQYEDTIVNAAGCDSIVTLHLALKSPDTTYTDVAQCAPYTWAADGITYNTDTTVYFTPATIGADSCANVLCLRYRQITNGDTIVVSTCETSYTWDMDGNTYSGSGFATYTKVNSGAGCDTIYTLSYTTGAGQYVLIDTTISALDSFVWVDMSSTTHIIKANAQRVDTVLTRTHESLTSCDSIETYNVTILPTYRIDTAFCGRGTGGFRWPNTRNPLIWMRQNGDTTYMCKDTEGKDSCLMYFTYTNLGSDTTWLPAIVACGEYTWDLNGVTYRTSADTIPYRLTNMNGCDSVVVLTSITINPLPNVYIDGNLWIRPGNSATLFAVGDENLTYRWSTGETTDTIVVTPSQNTEYSITATDGNSCQRTSTATVVVSESINQANANTVKVFPNPASTKVTIEGDNLTNVKLYNMLGQLIVAKEAVSGKVVIPVSEYNNGSYILRAENNDGKTTIRSVVIKK